MILIVIYLISLVLGCIGGLGRYNPELAKITSGIYFFGLSCTCVYIWGRYSIINILGVIAVSLVGAFIIFSISKK